MSEEVKRMSEERRVTVLGPTHTFDFYDAVTGVRFVQGRAENVPLSIAEELHKRRDYEIEGVPKTRRRVDGFGIPYIQRARH